MRPGRLTALFALALAPAVAASAATPPSSLSAGAAQRRNQEQQQRLERSQRNKGVHGPVVVGPKGAKHHVKPGGPHFTLKQIKFTPSHFLKAAKLKALAQPYLHHPITLAKLYDLVAKVNSLYAERGLITDRAILPPQKITSGVVRIQLVEGKVGVVQMRSLTYTDKHYVHSRLPLKKGQVLDAAALEHAIVYFDRTNDLALKAQLRPGSHFGLTNVLLQAIEPPRYRLNLLLNNEGDNSTGRLQGGLYGLMYGPLGIGDRLSLYAMGSRGAFNANVGYQLPLTRSGLKLSVSAAHNQIHIINGPYQQLDIRGHATIGQIGLTQPLLATRNWLLTTAGTVSYTDDHTNISGVALSDNRIWTPGVGLTVNFDQNRQSWDLTQTVERGFAHEVLGQDQAYWLLQGSLIGSAGLIGPLFATFNGAWQYSNANNLPSSQLYQLGGAQSIPGYPVGAVAGTKGFNAHGALHVSLPWSLALGAGYSYGVVYAKFPSRTALSSVDIALQGQFPRFHVLAPLSWEVSVAHPTRTVVPNQSNWTTYFRIIAPIVF